MIANGNLPSTCPRASSVACRPRFHVGLRTVHCVFLSVPSSIQKKLPDGSPPPRAKVSTCTSPGGTSQALAHSPEAHGVPFFTSLRPPLPERRFPLDHPGFTLVASATSSP